MTDFVIMVDRPKVHSPEVNRESLAEFKQTYHEEVLENMLLELFRHHEAPFVYKFSEDAQAGFDLMLSEKATETNSRYPTDSG